MKKKIIAFSGSNSKNSVNQQFVTYVASQIQRHEAQVINLANYPLPIYNIDIEVENGFAEPLNQLLQEIKNADALIISVSEHNGSISAFFKNILDWLSRIEYKFFENKKILAMSTSPGARGGVHALEYLNDRIPRHGGTLIDSFSFPEFDANFSKQNQTITNEILKLGVIDVIQNFEQQISL